MMRFLPNVLQRSIRRLVVCLVAVTVAGSDGASSKEPVFTLGAEDPQLNLAIIQARDTLNDFLGLLESGVVVDDRALKVAVPTDEGACCEHIWMVDFERRGGVFRARVANDPVEAKYLRLGQIYQFQHGQISDWSYWVDGKLYGAYTVRALLPRMTPADRARYQAILAPLSN